MELTPVNFIFIVSGGFATINPDNSLNINAVEAFPIEELSLEVFIIWIYWRFLWGTIEEINSFFFFFFTFFIACSSWSR